MLLNNFWNDENLIDNNLCKWIHVVILFSEYIKYVVVTAQFEFVIKGIYAIAVMTIAAIQIIMMILL